MPIPLIAAAFILFGGATGGSGAALGGRGALNMKRARDRLKAAETHYSKARHVTEKAVAATNVELSEYRHQQESALAGTVLRLGEFLRRNSQQVNESERMLVDGIEAAVGTVVNGQHLDADAVAWAMGIVKSGIAGAGVSTGLTTAVGAYGVASTGAAISGLSGAAAESATLAFLGGGSLASGGGGMALGATVLNVVTIGPALLVGGFVVQGQSQKALTRAREYEAKVAIELEIEKARQNHLGHVCDRVRELSILLSGLVRRAVRALDVLESEEFDNEAHTTRFQHALTHVLAVRDVATTPIVDGDGELTARSKGLTIKYRLMTEA